MFNKSMFNSEGKVRAISFQIIWSEGYPGNPGGLKDVTFSTWKAMSEATQGIAMAQSHDGGYCKTKFNIIFADGFEYGGRLDIQSTGEDCDIGQHIIDWCEFNTGTKPEWMSDEQYASVYRTESAAEYQNVLDTYELVPFPHASVIEAHEAKLKKEIDDKKEAERLGHEAWVSDQELFKGKQSHNPDAPITATAIKPKKTKYNPDPESSTWNADIYPGEKIRVWGHYSKNITVYFDHTFHIGDRVKYESRHWGNYYGSIAKISAKTVAIEPEYKEKPKRLDLYTLIEENI